METEELLDNAYGFFSLLALLAGIAYLAFKRGRENALKEVASYAKTPQPPRG